jgi:hypothetical protein
MVAKALKNVVITDEVAKFDPSLARDGGVYVSTRTPPLLIHTPTVTLTSDLVESEDAATFANLKVKACTAQFFKDVEAAVVALAIDRKGSWFREDIPDDVITHSLRSFLNDGVLRVRVAEGLVAYNAAKAKVDLPAKGTRVRAVLELARITFSKTQFGAVWNLKQVRLTEESSYLFDEDVVEGLAEEINESILAVDDGDQHDLADELTE